jgi:hypothetical protein
MKSVLLISLFAAACSILCGCHSGVDTIDEKAEKSFKAVSEPAVILHRRNEPNENAFSFLLPEGWTIAGGITRVDHNTGEFTGHSIEAKLYLKLSSPDNKAGMAWLPDMRYIDTQRYPDTKSADGNNFTNMMVMSILVPADFIRLVAFPFAHPHARMTEITGVQALPGLVDKFRLRADSLVPGNELSYQAAIATVEYTENDVRYLEKMVCVIEDEGIKGSGRWGNRATWYVRAEQDKFDAFVPIFTSIRQSIQINTKSDMSSAIMYSLIYDEKNPLLTKQEN